uniref:TaqI-like C-terminal specificity domain-containing protein n=1 Tax=Sulfurovum sp. TaxID=1969726 RepID=UPI0025D4BED0
NLPFNIFEDAYVDTAIYIFKKQQLDKYRIYNFDKKSSVNGLNGLDFDLIPISAINKDDFKLIQNKNVYKIQEKISQCKTKKLGDISISTQGLSGSNFPKNNSGELYPYLNMGNVYNYKLEIIETYETDMSKHKSIKKFYDKNEKILIRRIINRQDRLTVGYTDLKLVFKKDINPFIITNNTFQTKYVLAILASKLISWIYVNISSIALKDDFRQTTLTELRSLSIPEVNKQKQQLFIDLANQIIEHKKQNQDTAGLEAQIDRMVYDLYGLTEEEIAVVEGN